MKLFTDSGLGYIDKVEQVSTADIEGLYKSQNNYGDSWKKRGGVGAFMGFVRKWDRIEEQLRKTNTFIHEEGVQHIPPYDIFGHIASDSRPEGIIDDIRDLRRYLLLVEAEMLARGFKG